MPKVRLVVAYQGTRYRGWQVQPQGPTVQETLELAYTKMTGQRQRFSAAGRTDAGVHARGQVVCFENPSRHGPADLKKGLNALLPEDIVVLEAAPAADDFDARRQALFKHYRYRIHNHPVRPLFDRQLCWHVKAPLDSSAMQAAADHLKGEHDFSSFRASGCEAKSPVRRIESIRWHSHPPRVILDVLGVGFLKQMVRNIAGTCVEIGRGSMQPSEMKEILSARDRMAAGPTAPATGLTLMQVFYEPADPQLILDKSSDFP
jgi:tRNA pseudouridine38-40 synthase